MGEQLLRRLENLRLMRVVRRRDEYCVEQLDPVTGAIGVAPGPSLETWRNAEVLRYTWAGLDLVAEDIDDGAEERWRCRERLVSHTNTTETITKEIEL